MTGAKPDERIRTPMRWDATAGTAGSAGRRRGKPLSDDLAGDERRRRDRATRASLLSSYRDLIGLRTAIPALSPRRLDRRRDVGADPVNAYLRQADGETVLVVANLGDQPVDGPAPTSSRGRCAVCCRRRPCRRARSASAVVDTAGGFSGYVPVARLEPGETVAVRLAAEMAGVGPTDRDGRGPGRAETTAEPARA